MPRVGTDSTAAKGAASRHGLGKLKHLELEHLWIQELVRARRVVQVKEASETDFADLMTKHLEQERMTALLKLGGYELRGGRPDGAPKLAKGAVEQRIALVLLGLRA